ncbi:hypothetical protein J132_03468 [Termitomyces sp. J132]|nr:hypothetical protein J132_03468 [Termitomyces sp. J132]
MLKALFNQRPHPAHYLLDLIHSTAEQLQTRDVINLQLHWVPGHKDFTPNKRADELAKTAAQGTTSNTKSLPVALCRSPLPVSISATR